MEIEKIEGDDQPVQVASELNARLGPPPFAGETDTEIMPDGSIYRSRYSFRVF
jgi:hypothetical protein